MTIAIPRWAGLLTVAGIAVIFASNHVAARLAFDHGTGVVTAVAVRSAATALVVLALLRIAGTAAGLPRATRPRAMAIGAMLAAQSVCLYAAVARLPVGLALLTFNTFPIVLALLSWATGGDRPARRTALAMPVLLGGLALALDAPGLLGGARALEDPARFAEGVGFALGASLSFAFALLATTRWLGDVDGRVRTAWTMGTVAVLVTAVAAGTGAFDWPDDRLGWLGLALLSLLYGIAFTSLFVLLPKLGAVNAAPALNAEPVAAMALAWLLLGQRVGALQVAGGLLVVGAIVWMGLGPKR